MFKFFDFPYFLIYDQSRFCFYVRGARSFDKVLEDSIQKIDVLIQYLKEYRIQNLTVFDHQPDSIIKFEKCLSSLSIFDFYAWYQKKKEIVFKNADWSVGKILWRDRALFLLGIQAAFLVNLKTLYPIELTVYSYSIELGCLLRQLLAKKKSLHAKTFLIAIDSKYQMNIWFFDEKKILFFRSWEGQNSVHLERQIKSAIIDTLRYLEKMTDQMGKMVFIMPQRKETVAHMLTMSFPEAAFFYDADVLSDQKLNEPKPHNTFDWLVLNQKERFFPLQEAKKSFKTYFRFGNLFSLLNLVLLFLLFLSGYQTASLFFQTRSVKHEMIGKFHQLEQLAQQNLNVPLSMAQIQALKSLEEACLHQQSRFWTFIEELALVLGNHYLLDKLWMTEEKTQLVIRAHKETGSMEELLHHWDQGLSEYPVQTTATESESLENAASLLKEPLILTCPSVLRILQKESGV